MNMTVPDLLTSSDVRARLKATVGPHGRVVIPVELRRRLGIAQGTVLTFTEQDGSLIVTDRRTAIRRIQEYFSHREPGADPVEELIQQRREESRREAEWMNE
jgi:AbrB family looped-hinge helix DNA binding protein